MGSKILSWVALILNFGIMVTIGITNFIINGWSATSMFFVFLASAAIFLLALRFNIVALRRDLTERMVIPNAGLVIVSLFLGYYYFQGFIKELAQPVVMYCVIGGLVLCFIAIFVFYWAIGRKRYD